MDVADHEAKFGPQLWWAIFLITERGRVPSRMTYNLGSQKSVVTQRAWLWLSPSKLSTLSLNHFVNGFFKGRKSPHRSSGSSHLQESASSLNAILSFDERRVTSGPVVAPGYGQNSGLWYCPWCPSGGAPGTRDKRIYWCDRNGACSGAIDEMISSP